MKKILAAGLVALAAALIPSTASAQTTDSLDITALVGPILSVTTFLPANPLVPAAGDVNVGTVQIISNNAAGFTMTTSNLNANSELLPTDPLGAETIPYTYYFLQFFGVLGTTAPVGPFSSAASIPATVAGDIATFAGPTTAATNVTYGVQMILDTSQLPANDIYTDTLTFTVADI